MSAISQLSSIYYQEGSNLTTTQEQMAIPPYNNVNEIANNYSNNTAVPYNFFIPPIHVVEADQDYFLRSYQSIICPQGIQNTLNDITGSNLYNNYLNFIRNTTDNLNANYGFNESYITYGDLGDTLIANQYANRSTPNFSYPIGSETWNNSVFINYNTINFSPYFMAESSENS